MVASIILGFCGCGKRLDDARAPSAICTAFQSSYIDLPTYEKTSSSAGDVTATQEHVVFLQACFSGEGDQIQQRLELVWTDWSGNTVATQEVENLYTRILYGISDTVYAIGPDEIGNFKAQAYTVSGPFGEIIDFDVQNVEDAILVGDTWAFVYYGGRVELFRDGQLVYTRPCHLDDMNRQSLTVQDGNVVFISSDEGGNAQLVILDPVTLSEKNVSPPDFSGDIPLSPCNSSFGFFYEGYQGIFRYDLSSSSMTGFMSAYDTDIPPSGYVYTEYNLPFVLDNDHIVFIRNPVTDSSACDPVEVVMLSRLKKNPHEEKTVLTLGGYGVTGDRNIQEAVYRFNTSGSEYRIRLREYAFEYMITSQVSFDQALARIISDLSSGKGDDIIYEEMFFNFSEMGRNGALVDMMPFIEKDPSLSAESWLPSIFELMKTDDSLYRFFPGFGLYGYVGNAIFPIDPDYVSAQKLLDFSHTLPSDVNLFPGVASENLFVSAILYGMEDYVDESGKFEISAEQVQVLLNYALTCGIMGPRIEDPYGNERYIREKQVLLYSTISSAQQFHAIEQMIPSETLFVGSPTLTGTARICSPSTSVAISDGTEYPEACWDFIKYLMMPEVQQTIIEAGYFPVGRDAFDSFMDQAIHPELRTAAENTGLDTYDKSAVPEDCVIRLKTIIDSLNTTDEVDYLLSQIILEDCMPALVGDKSAAETANVLNNRINIYLQSQ